MRKERKLRGVEALKSRYGLMFVSIWIIGFALFFFTPLCQSIAYSFSEVVVGSESYKFVGFEHYKVLLKEDPHYIKNLTSSITSIAYSLPLILVVSLVLALILNQKFPGRLFFRAVYFLPVIIATGVVMQYLTGYATSFSEQTDASVSQNMMNVSDIMNVLNLPVGIATHVQRIISNIFSFVWKSGIQIVLFIAGLQSVPASLYEASRVEGASPWEDFWFITFPMLSRVTLLVGVFTMIELFTDEAMSPIIKSARLQMQSGVYDSSSAMLWMYFLVVAAIMGIVLFLYNRMLMRRWE